MSAFSILDPSLSDFATFVSYFSGAVLSVGAGLWIARYGERDRPDRVASFIACAFTAVWCSLAALQNSSDPATMLAATLRNLSYIFLIFRMFAADGRDESLRPIRPVLITLALVELFQPILLFVDGRVGFVPQLEALTFEVSVILNMLVAVGALMLLHNLYASAATPARDVLRWGTIGLACVFAYDLNLFTIAYLDGELPFFLMSLRGLFCGVMVGLFALGANAASSALQFRPSRAVTFQTLSLLVIGGYLVLMVLVTRSLALLGGDIARASQVVFLVMAVALAVIGMPSNRVRRWLRVTATKHLFQHRYDYREEWLRFTRTVGRGSSGSASFHERAIKAIADITDSPGGLLLISNEEAQLELTQRWNWPMIEVPAARGEYELSALLERHSHILDLDEVRGGIDHHGELDQVPQWLIDAEDAWALVPLIHFDRLIGCIVLARPRITRRLDWEDFDLLRVVGQQLASYLAEQAGQRALMDASRFDEFNRRMAFVMHDIKNLASQLSLLAANAQKHADNPEFRKDMLVTLQKSSEKLNALLARLGRYGSGPVQTICEVDLWAMATSLEQRFAAAHPIAVTSSEGALVLGDKDGLEQALIHLVQNAIDASEPDAPIHITVSSDTLHGRLEIVDAGCGMSPDFVSTSLYKPFVSSKQGGFGIGAFEAREMIKAMGGRLQVESREGVGTRFTVLLPLPEAARLFSPKADSKTESSEQVA
ncbi:MAG: PEP-CTERM system histidine kinase PrsK [Erythrobacter sp.]|uniref:XrtA/PEP-CTERM system histidine kinase PrsK n=1 Tax=Erythrobacter sp. TaxID=1042 RepID=UPI00260513BB|nr:XrtA/PEP-CTERM system histidine kinase PrsK [Erythrobacter sp.]MDJ0977443.1 PEP-CTERM system histidine kinase PrsK [Erythrobacter sp.]